jgi:membrane protease subunit (stomatin/prohibitin family)
LFYGNVSGTRDTYYVSDLEGQLRNTIVAKMTDIFAPSEVAFVDMAANQGMLAEKIAGELKPVFAGLGLELAQFVVENVSLPDELQQVLDQRIGATMAGDLGRYTRFQAAQSLPVAAANPGGAAGVGVGLGAGLTMAQTMMSAMKAAPEAPAPAAAAESKFCIECGQSMPSRAKFCPKCGKPQS